MISVEQASEIVQMHAPLLGTENTPIEQAHGRILRESILADRDFPPFDRVAMDGIAIPFAAFQIGQKQFKIGGQMPAGAAPIVLTNPDECMEVATGAVLPKGTDTVIPYEQIQISENLARITTEDVRYQQNIHHQGIDQKNGDILLESGRLIGPAEISILATVGKTTIKTSRILRIAIVATGDELVEIGTTPLPWQIRQSNPYALKSLLNGFPVRVESFHCKDDFGIIKNLVGKILAEYDLLLLSGGVSAGKRDFIPDVLHQTGVEILFHKVTQRPGKPLLFGQIPGSGATVFALPGNPVSAFMCTCRYVLPWLAAVQGLAPKSETWAVLAEPLAFKPNLTWFVPVKIENRKGMNYALPKPGHGSGDLANLEKADGFLELPKGPDLYGTNEAFRFIRYRS